MITTASGGTLRASITGDGKLALTTVREGSAAHLKVQADTDAGVLTALNLTAASALPASQGTDGKIKFGTSAEVDVTDTAASTAIDVAGTTVTASFSAGLRAGSVTARQISTGDGSLAAVVSAVNGANAGMTAAAVQVSPGVYKLQIASKTTGLSGALTFGADAFGATETLTAAADAQLTVGGTLRVTSATNVFADVLPGVTLTATSAAPGTPVTLNVASDSGALADKVAKMVEGVNGVLSYVKLQGAYNADTKAAGPLLGDALARRVTGDLYRELGQTGFDLHSVGLSITKEGFLSFDRAAFTTAYDKDPAAVAGFFHDASTTPTTDDGLGKRLEALAKRATDTVGGLITGAIAGRKSEATTVERQVAAWDVRLTKREAVLRRQFAGLETALSNLRNQSTWLAGQLSGLAGSS
jgi:flagellar hook-associated protein 2